MLDLSRMDSEFPLVRAAHDRNDETIDRIAPIRVPDIIYQDILLVLLYLYGLPKHHYNRAWKTQWQAMYSRNENHSI